MGWNTAMPGTHAVYPIGQAERKKHYLAILCPRVWTADAKKQICVTLFVTAPTADCPVSGFRGEQRTYMLSVAWPQLKPRLCEKMAQ